MGGPLMEQLEGKVSVQAAVEARLRKIEVVLVSAAARAEKVADLLDACAKAGVPVKRVPAADLDRMTHGKTHGGVVAIATPRSVTPLDDLIRAIEASGEVPLLLLLEGIDDARNLGFTLRTADALGTHGVLLKKHAWDFDGGEVSRASSGAYERLPLAMVEDAAGALRGLARLGVKAWGCVAGAKRSAWEADLAAPTLLAVGGEKRGLSGAMRDLCDGFLRIPMRPGATSLSLSHAAAILLAEARRQRTSSSGA